MPKRKRPIETPTFSVPSSVVFQSGGEASVDRLHPNGRQVIREKVPFYVPPDAAQEADDTTPTEDLAQTQADIDLEAGELPKVTGRQFATLEHDSVLRQWSQQTGYFLDELMRLEGLRGASIARCPLCAHSSVQPALYRCDDCSGGLVLCKGCCVRVHQTLPFHKVKAWTGTFFKSTTLQDLGLIIQLGHPVGEACPSPLPGAIGALVMHTNGIHPVTLQYCHCDQVHLSGDRLQQLLRFELYPATLHDPTTFGTFRLLEHFHLLTLQSKINATDFYTALELATDIVGTSRSFDRLKPFLRIVREWRLLKMLKRAGRAFIPNGTTNIAPGELSVPCLACPKVGFNIPVNWHTVSDDLKYIYTLMIAVDANFRLKRRTISSNDRDPALGSGWGYFVEDTAYSQHVLNYANQEDISTCTGFAALAQANTKFTAGYSTTGVVMCICARHGVILPNGVADLQKGERFCNIDYALTSAVKIVRPKVEPKSLPLGLSYDIICQWMKNIMMRFSEDRFPEHLRIELPEGEVRYMIPKYHFNGHKEKDHNRYSLNLVRGSGRMDGEEIERTWSRHNAISASTREMGPGSRHDTLDDHFGWHNFLKMVGLGQLLKRRLAIARAGKTKFEALYNEFSEALKSDNLNAWLTAVTEWENDFSKPDPYYVEPTGLTEAQIRAQLAEEDVAGSDEDDEDGNSRPRISPSAMLVEMMEVEDQQRRFRLKYPKVDTIRNPLHVADIIQKRANLRRRLRAIREVQAKYMPPVHMRLAKYNKTKTQPETPSTVSTSARVAQLRSIASAVAAEPALGPESEPLFFPATLTVEELDLCRAGLAKMESRLRLGQMRSALDKLRVQLHIKSRLVTFKNQNVRAQAHSTRAINQLSVNEGKAVGHAEKYRAAREAYLQLVGPGTWERTWRRLDRADIRCLRDSMDPAFDEVGSEGRRELSWIWQHGDRHEDSAEAGVLPGISRALQAEFLRTRARAMRHEEEVNILEEEQRRTLVSLEQYALLWDARRDKPERKVPCAILQQGMEAYAAEQAAIRRNMSAHFQGLWGFIDYSSPTHDIGSEPAKDADGVGLQVGVAGDESDEEL